MHQDVKQYLSESLSDINSYQKFINFHSVLTKPSINVKDTGIPSRVMSYWRTNDLMPEINPDSGWNKFNFVDYVWLRVIHQMRSFGVPLETIKLVKRVLLEKANIIWNPETLDELIKHGVTAIEKLDLPQVDKSNLIELLSNPGVKEKVKEENLRPTMLGCLINIALLEYEEVGVLVFATGQVIPWKGEFQSNTGLGTYLRLSHIYVSITSLIREFLSDRTKERYFKPYLLITEEELEVLKRIRQKDLQEILIKFPQGSGKENLEIITKKKVGLSKDQQDEICRILSLKNYQSVSIKTQGDGKLYIEKSHRKKL